MLACVTAVVAIVEPGSFDFAACTLKSGSKSHAESDHSAEVGWHDTLPLDDAWYVSIDVSV